MWEMWRLPLNWRVLLSVLALGTGVSSRGQESCFACHPAPDLSRRIAGGRRTTPEVETLAFKGDAHVGLSCTECHSQATAIPHPPGMRPVTCEGCHPTVRAHVVPSTSTPSHSQKMLPTCVYCHGYHGVLRPETPGSPVSRRHVVDLCLKCHSSSNDGPINYRQSVHGKAHARDPSSAAAVCTDCHSAHPTEERGTLLTLVSRSHLPATCGKCHDDVLRAYRDSVHGKAVTARKREAAICTDCHGSEHNILASSDPKAQAAAARISRTCAKCHADTALIRAYGLSAHVVPSYERSYHGIANRFGGLAVANCASCHGAHDILPSSDPRSSVHPANLANNCGKCHGDVGQNVALGRVHLQVSRTAAPAVFWTAFGFRWLTILTMSALIGHILLDLAKRLKLRREAARSGP